MSVLQVTDIQSNSTSFNTPVVFKTSGGVENGTLCRAWINYNGTGTIAIRNSFNVNSIADLGSANVRVTFANELADADYAIIAEHGTSRNTTEVNGITSTYFDIQTKAADTGAGEDTTYVFCAVFR